jgi:long-subunit fatty acid transport protein
MRKLVILGSLVALLVPTASQAQFSLGLRVGFAPAMGDAAKDQKMSDGVKSQIPVQLDAAYKVTPEIAVGAYASYGFGQQDIDVCSQGIDCSARVVRFGLQGSYTFNQVQAALVPWAGVGFGYEMGGLEMTGGGEKATYDYSGFEFLNLQVGGDYKVNEQFSVGPYLQFSIAQYSNAKFENSVDPAENFDGSITDKGVHEWFGFGLRGKFDL